MNTAACDTALQKYSAVLYCISGTSDLMDLPMAKLIKLAKMVGVMHEADHAYSIRSTW